MLDSKALQATPSWQDHCKAQSLGRLSDRACTTCVGSTYISRSTTNKSDEYFMSAQHAGVIQHQSLTRLSMTAGQTAAMARHSCHAARDHAARHHAARDQDNSAKMLHHNSESRRMMRSSCLAVKNRKYSTATRHLLCEPLQLETLVVAI